jgi:hypothetical protein
MEETNMNNWDRDNLNFILNTTDEAFSDWMLQADSDDINYAIELITQHRQEINLKEFLLKADSIDVSDTKQAKSILQKYRI